nr:zinc-ribbon domain-containing protein [Streptomyces boncukensis]
MLNLLCAFCGNPAAHALRKKVTKFSLFFIPLFPVTPAKHTLQCTFCGGMSEVSKENAEAWTAQQSQPGPGQPGVPSGNPYAGNQPG